MDSDSDGPPPPERAGYHLALGEAYRLSGENDLAAMHYRAALVCNRNLAEAHVGLSLLRMPGDFYLAWLERFYTVLAPATIIEIGVAEGASMACARPPTIAIGVDPQPRIAFAFRTETHIFTETSDDFFTRRGP